MTKVTHPKRNIAFGAGYAGVAAMGASAGKVDSIYGILFVLFSAYKHMY